MGTDSLYYITDYSGNYYRTNQADQLVTAAGVQEAQIFTFAQANRRIGAGKKAAFYCMIPMENETEQEEKHDQAAEQEQSVSPVKELTYDEVEEQAEFYRNAEQYITNIQLDIDEIDDEIEAILLQTEDANYNVAQGYKVFKRLKELRIERKEKEKELDCLYALTDTIDCPSLASVCEESLAEIEDIMDVQPGNDSTDIFEADTEQEEIHVVKNINEMAG